ncbi:hypothetical protein PHLGIDRAFT_514697 [Phlebiopsis gigantea 11061_1 CR5-6]|uniref:Spindle pole body component n=1 Tax=Phlebiopsis gigantea (strain 11061_1 CR5-6) TaxID=745531 RepID=A0A0C3S9Y8_PHLG1|nr:hypothetical protein PHLGIDRAFT_514697 [Phlebiopsis gigantea 11061_1 CR5-6]
MDVLEQLKSTDLGLSPLPELCSSFRITKLAEKPQNPIMDSLQFVNLRNAKALPEINIEALRPFQSTQHDIIPDLPEKSLWKAALECRHTVTDTTRSWDVLVKRPIPTASAFISERSSYTLAAARHIVLATFQSENTRVINVLPSELYDYIQLTLSGLSSPLHVWDTKSQTFLIRGLASHEMGKFVISGLDDEETDSLVQRFVTIGTQLRRLEMLILELQDITAYNRKHLHAFGYSLTSVLSSIRAGLSEIVSSRPRPTSQDDIQAVSSLWSSCSEVAEQIRDVAAMCGRDMSVQPNQYPALSQTASELLTRIYKHFQLHIDNSSPHAITAISAFILSLTSEDYLEHVCEAVGYIPRRLATTKPSLQDRQSTGLFDDDLQQPEDATNEEADVEDTYPCFFDPQLSKGVARARESLKLLHTARPDHPLLAHSEKRPRIRWFWSNEDVEAAWLGTTAPNSEFSPEPSPIVSKLEAAGDEVALRVLQIFDLEPGAHLQSNSPSSSSRSPNPFLRFQDGFPSRLPPLAPTLETLRDLVLAPLEAHVDSLSAALLDTFLSRSSGYLDFRRHLSLLRSYLLLTSHSFKARLQAALFSDAPEPISTDSSARTMAVRARKSLSRRRTPEPTADFWSVGLAPALTVGSSWPPGGSDLSFYLRTVIIDSLDSDYCLQVAHSDASEVERKDQLLEEAEWRLGFAIRDLPVGARARWLNPRSMEAMDFLYMNYQPPHPLDVLIPQSTLSKYHRVFAFNLRLMRVENVTKALFRMTRQGSASAPLFETLTASRQLFLYFRFIASSFVSALSSYVYDIAIGDKFDSFLNSLASPLEREPGNTLPVFSDVFALAEYHSNVMDDVLSACLLRSNQKAVGDLLRGALEIILEFGILMSDLRSGRMREYEAAAPLEGLFFAYRCKMGRLHKALKELIDKSASLTESTSENPDIHAMSGSLPAVAASLHDLLTRLSIPESWQSSR